MDSESLAQIQQIVNAATETIEARLGERIAEVQRHTEARLGERIAEAQQHTEARLGERIAEAQQHTEARLGERIVEVQRHTGVLIEDVHHKLNLVIDGQQVLHHEIANVRAEMQQESQETRALLHLSYQQLHQRVEILEQ